MEPADEIVPDGNNRAIIYQGVNGYNDKLEVITLWNDLRCTKSVKKMGVNLEKSIPNIKKIIECNRKVTRLL